MKLVHFLFWLQECKKQVFVVATANDVSMLPSELLRRGRFDELFFVDLPTADERRDILSLYMRKYLELDFCGTFAEEIVELTDGFTGADLESTVRDLAYRSITNDNFVLNEEKYDMPKPMLRQPQIQTQSSTILNTTQNHQQKHTTQQMDKMRLDRLLRKTRSKRYMDALHELDADGHTHKQNKVNEIIDAICSEFPEIEISGILLGFVSMCYLGKPYPDLCAYYSRRMGVRAYKVCE